MFDKIRTALSFGKGGAKNEITKESSNINMLHGNSEAWKRIDANQTEILKRIDEIWKRIDENQQDNLNRIDEIWARIDRHERTYRETGFQHLKGRIDERLMRLEVLVYYSNPVNYDKLSDEKKKFIDKLLNEFDYYYSFNQPFVKDTIFPEKYKSGLSCEGEGIDFDLPRENIKENEFGTYLLAYGHKIYLQGSISDAEEYVNDIYSTIDADNSPHTYLRPADDGLDILDGDIICDVGAAEGYFGMKYLERAKKIYFFESDDKWLEKLRKTCEPYMDKIEIIKGFVGCRDGEIKLDDYFRDKEKPTVIKMDIEGAESVALTGAKNILQSDGRMLLLCCTYHHQDDQENLPTLLSDDYKIFWSNGYYYQMENMKPPFLRKVVMRAIKEK